MAAQNRSPLPCLLAAASLAAVLAACQPANPPAPEAAAAGDGTSGAAQPPALATGERVNYQCGELALGAIFDASGQGARVSWSGQRTDMANVIAASGARYVDEDGNEFWTRGMEEGRLTLAGQEPRNCVRTNRASPWDLAADAGVSFRAVGQEPGWLAELTAGPEDDGASLTAHLDYGQRLLEVTGVQREGDVWRGESVDGTGIRLTVEERDCSDPMSGEQFRAAATLVVDGEEYAGCGSWLAAD